MIVSRNQIFWSVDIFSGEVCGSESRTLYSSSSTLERNGSCQRRGTKLAGARRREAASGQFPLLAAPPLQAAITRSRRKQARGREGANWRIKGHQRIIVFFINLFVHVVRVTILHVDVIMSWSQVKTCVYDMGRRGNICFFNAKHPDQTCGQASPRRSTETTARRAEETRGEGAVVALIRPCYGAHYCPVLCLAVSAAETIQLRATSTTAQQRFLCLIFGPSNCCLLATT